MTYAQQALEHPAINSENVWEDCFYDFPLHPYSTGIQYSGGVWQVDGGYACVFADSSMLIWNDATKSFRATTWDIDEALSDFDEDEVLEIKAKVAEMTV